MLYRIRIFRKSVSVRSVALLSMACIRSCITSGRTNSDVPFRLSLNTCLMRPFWLLVIGTFRNRCTNSSFFSTKYNFDQFFLKMATFLLSNAKVFLPSLPSTSSTSTSHTQPQPQQIVCRAASNELSSIVATRRSAALSLTSAVAAFLFAANLKAGAAILEADDDVELLEKVKRDRKKRLDRQGVIKSSTKETAYLQDVVYKLSKIGQALENNNLSEASSVLGSSNTEWLQKVNSALNKLSDGEEEKTEVDIFNLSLASLITSISQNDVEASKIAFVASASAFEKWTTLSGLAEQLKGL